MENPETLYAGLTENFDESLKTDIKKFLIRILILIVVNAILFGLLIKGPKSTTDYFLTALNANLIGYNILGFILGTLVALFPFKGLPYKKKYLRASLLTILVLQIIFTIGLILIGLMTLLGWY
ncbi:hypothetical protein JQC67_12960 [Aurantibacter crassamenti]|uniref:hypothetical protein n=1 Tax=Aurantibacter crassamenti TaxID=1837375 RepID=UPI0019395C0A|nr:hypothetical protein [Aurantibacter crassamenti]MBM1107055.1 hypothetical protein [Aurantibacter crassamenti]